MKLKCDKESIFDVILCV